MSTASIDRLLAREIAEETVHEFGPGADLADACGIAAADPRVSADDVPAYEAFMESVMEYIDELS